ncbi:MAG: hypothetical protein AB1Z57_09210 [Acidimicrobiia bacterium]
MSTLTPKAEAPTQGGSVFVSRTPSRTLVTWVAILSFVVGFGAILGGLGGMWYTYDQAATQDITTPDDAAIPSTPVRGPFTMWAQADIITHHQLDRTEGLFYAQMPRFVDQVDENGEPVIGEDGEVVQVPNEARSSWFSATTLTNALSLGILAYALGFMAVAFGALFVLNGFLFWSLRPVRMT